MNITIIGAGAIGGVIGAYLTKGGEDVTFVDVAVDHIEKMQEEGLTIKGKEDTFTIPVKAYTLDDFVRQDKELDIVFLCVKALHTKEAVNRFKHMLTSSSAVVSFQNGLCEREIASIIGEERTVGCFVNLFADYLEPGLINYGGVGAVYIGELSNEVSPRVEKIVERLKLWGNAKATDNIEGYLWGKLSYGAVLTATALTNMSIADVLSSNKYRELIIELASEPLAVAAHNGVSPEGFDDWEPQMFYPEENRNEVEIDEQINRLVSRLRQYTKTRTGIWRDLAVRKRRTEVPFQLAPIIHEGENKGVDMTLTSATLQMIMDIEEGISDFSADNLDYLVELVDTKKSQTI